MGLVSERALDGWSVTPEKTTEAVRRIVAFADPLKIILFGSRARAMERPDSDLDLAVILEAPEDATEAEVRRKLPYSVLRGLRMEVTLVVASQAKYDLHSPLLNSIFHNIRREGIVLYERKHRQSSHHHVVPTGAGRRVDSGTATT